MLNIISALLPSMVWTLVGGIFLTVGDVFLRMWFASDLRYGFLLAFILYMTGIFCMMMSFFDKHIATATIAAVLINAILYILVSRFMYGDSVNMLQIGGIILGLVAFIILEIA